jgi:hypothetical protein
MTAQRRAGWELFILAGHLQEAATGVTQSAAWCRMECMALRHLPLMPLGLRPLRILGLVALGLEREQLEQVVLADLVSALFGITGGPKWLVVH